MSNKRSVKMLIRFGIRIHKIFSVLGCLQCFILDGLDKSRCPGRLRHSGHVRTYKEHCYEFILDKTDYWDTANDDCKARGGHLVVIKDKYEQMFLMTSLRSLGYKGTSLWIGLSDQKVEQEWKWVTGERLHGYRHWSNGQDEAGIFHNLQDCVYMRYSDSGLWYDTTCHVWPEYFNYICQYDMIPTTTRRTTTTTTPTTRPTATTTTLKTTNVTSLPTTVGCAEIDCGQTCQNGYTGLQVGLDGCIHCLCS